MLDRQEQAGMHTYKPGKGEFSISWPSRGEGDGNDDKGAKDNSMRKRTIERNTGLQWDKPPSKATWSWSHPTPHALVATQVDLHKLSIVSTLPHFLLLALQAVSTPQVLYLSRYHTLFNLFRVLLASQPTIYGLLGRSLYGWSYCSGNTQATSVYWVSPGWGSCQLLKKLVGRKRNDGSLVVVEGGTPKVNELSTSIELILVNPLLVE
ncbi:hypothetical protein DFH08DRAFT_806832 [Mycena albidolilacea]|uniref:Uncharacterized protein n=1 Tax=Mycena albidolilacea TaxID=1033008 RepID=A0AAD7A7S0_9AGAR|nr:hypothetical protein DFH08DRAFT_806832 [Mycena albidolilacea]